MDTRRDRMDRLRSGGMPLFPPYSQESDSDVSSDEMLLTTLRLVLGLVGCGKLRAQGPYSLDGGMGSFYRMNPVSGCEDTLQITHIVQMNVVGDASQGGFLIEISDSTSHSCFSIDLLPFEHAICIRQLWSTLWGGGRVCLRRMYRSLESAKRQVDEEDARKAEMLTETQPDQKPVDPSATQRRL